MLTIVPNPRPVFLRANARNGRETHRSRNTSQLGRCVIDFELFAPASTREAHLALGGWAALLAAGCHSRHVQTSVTASGGRWSGGWQVQHRQPLGSCASHHQRRLRQQEQKHPWPRAVAGSAQLGGRCSAASRQTSSASIGRGSGCSRTRVAVRSASVRSHAVRAPEPEATAVAVGRSATFSVASAASSVSTSLLWRARSHSKSVGGCRR